MTTPPATTTTKFNINRQPTLVVYDCQNAFNISFFAIGETIFMNEILLSNFFKMLQKLLPFFYLGSMTFKLEAVFYGSRGGFHKKLRPVLSRVRTS